MLCPFCGRDNDRVVDSRSCEGGKVTRRRRLCNDCDRRFTTYERVEGFSNLRVAKSDDVREPYQREKILLGLEKACFKRPVSSEQILRIVEKAEEVIFKKFEKDVPSRFIGDTVSGLLREVDKIAFVRFASVYRSFKDVGELIDAAEGVRDEPLVGPEQKGLFEKDE